MPRAPRNNQQQAGGAAPAPRGRRPRVPRRRTQGPSPRQNLRALAMLAHAASVSEPLAPNAGMPNPHGAPDLFEEVPAAEGNHNQDLNHPPAEAAGQGVVLEAPQGDAPNVEHLQPIPFVQAQVHVPIVNAFEQLGLGFPLNFNGGMPVLNIRVRSLNLGDGGVPYTIGVNESMYRVFSDYAARVDLQMHEITMKKFNDIISPFVTAGAAGINDGDILTVEAQNPEINVDTRVKVFKMQDLTSLARVMPVTALPSATLHAVYTFWGGQNGVDAGGIIGFCENEVLSSLQTVREARIKNGAVVYVFPNNGNP